MVKKCLNLFLDRRLGSCAIWLKYFMENFSLTLFFSMASASSSSIFLSCLLFTAFFFQVLIWVRTKFSSSSLKIGSGGRTDFLIAERAFKVAFALMNLIRAYKLFYDTLLGGDADMPWVLPACSNAVAEVRFFYLNDVFIWLLS
jgi:hypothetical protein